MGFLDRMFGSSAEGPEAQDRPPKAPKGSNAYTTRRELLRVALRDTLVRHGIPTEWIAVETLPAAMKGREPGVHMRLVLRHWEPKLLTCMVALQKSISHRVMLFDPLASGWLMGISWQLSPADESKCPGMPDPSEWKAAGSAQPAKPVKAAAPPAATPAPTPAPDKKALLERMFASSSGPRRTDSEDAYPEFSATQPMFDQTQPVRRPKK